MSGAPVKKLPASSRVSSPSVPVADRGSEKVNVGFSNFGAGRSNQLRDPRARRSAGNNRKFSLGNEFHSGPPLYHIKEVMFYTAEWKRDYFLCHFANYLAQLFCSICCVVPRLIS